MFNLTKQDWENYIMPYLSILSNDFNVIPYRKELNAITGGVTSTILLQQIIYWWEKSERQPFYKFIEPCGHEKYKAGDSWVEETGLSRKEFLTAIKRLEDAELVSKKTNQSRITYYWLHEKELKKHLEGIYQNAERGFTKMPKGDLPIYTENTTYIDQNSSSKALEDGFDIFWASGMRKVSKKEALAKFKALVRDKKVDPVEFAEKLSKDIKQRLAANQFGFKSMHPSTYLSQERWTDELVNNEQSNNPEPKQFNRLTI